MTWLFVVCDDVCHDLRHRAALFDSDSFSCCRSDMCRSDS